MLLNSSSIQETPFPRCVQIWNKVKLWPKWPDPDTPIVSDCVRKCHICSFMYSSNCLWNANCKRYRMHSYDRMISSVLLSASWEWSFHRSSRFWSSRTQHLIQRISPLTTFRSLDPFRYPQAKRFFSRRIIIFMVNIASLSPGASICVCWIWSSPPLDKLITGDLRM